MIRRNIWLIALGGIALMGITSLAHRLVGSIEKLELTIESEKKAYELGEPVSFSFQLRNHSGENITILDDFGVGTGNLRIEVSEDGKYFTGFNNPRWGTIDTTRKTVIEVGKHAVASGAVLWSWQKQDVPQFRLQTPGLYFFRARYNAHIDGVEERSTLVSEPIKVMISEPQAVNLEVWKNIKANGHFAYLLLENDLLIPTYKTEERSKFQAEVERILQNHPDSVYSERLRSSLYKFRAKEAKRQDDIQRLQTLKSP
jgi:hypothetical protein